MIPFRLTILGTNAALPAYGRFTSMQVLQYNEDCFMIDCGEGAQIRIAQYKIKKNKIKAIFLSHLHGDHLFGLPGLITSFSHHNRIIPLKIIGPKGIKRFIDTTLEVSASHLKYELEVIELDHEDSQCVHETSEILVSAFPMKHRIPTYGYVFREREQPLKIDKKVLKKHDLSIDQIKDIKAGKYIEIDGRKKSFELFTLPRNKARSYAYCSDTIYDRALVPHIKEVDVLYHETTYLNDLAHLAEERMHSTSKEAAQIAKEAQVGKLITGHYSSRYKKVDDFLAEAQSVFPNSFIGYDGGIFQL